MASYLTRRQRSYGTAAVDNNSTSTTASLIAHHSPFALPRSRGNGSGSGRNRRRGSLFAALSVACKPSRIVFPPSTGRDGGEVVGLRSSTFTWAIPLEHTAATTAATAAAAAVAASAPATTTTEDGGAVEQEQRRRANASKRSNHVVEKTRELGSTTTSTTTSSTPVVARDSPALVLPAMQTAGAVAGAALTTTTTTAARRPSLLATSSPATTTTTKAPSRVRRRVTWAGNVETIEVARTTSGAVFSPDLHAMEIAMQLSVLAEEPGLARAVEAVALARQQAAGVIRSLTAREAWAGSLDGVEEACRLSTWREITYWRETDALVRQLSVQGGGGEGTAGGDDGRADKGKTIWRLKDAFRAARRRMDDPDSD